MTPATSDEPLAWITNTEVGSGLLASPMPLTADWMKPPSTQVIADRYLKFTRQFNAAFLGFDTDVQGLVESAGEAGTGCDFVDCVRG